MNNDALTRFIGGSPARVLVRLVLMSLLVGLVLSALNIHPLEIVDWFRELAEKNLQYGLPGH